MYWTLIVFLSNIHNGKLSLRETDQEQYALTDGLKTFLKKVEYLIEKRLLENVGLLLEGR